MRGLVVLWMVMVGAAAGCSGPPPQKSFATAEEAAMALVNAVRAEDTSALIEILGPEAKPMVESGDPVQDRNARTRFVQAYERQHLLLSGGDGSKTLQIGPDSWPFPYPLSEHEGRWQFDSSAGAHEIVNRRVGANELSTIQSCLAFVDAQREYYVRNPQRDSLLQYAKVLFSAPGKKDGLYWPTARDERPSPMGERFARARSEGYFAKEADGDVPFRGYVYRLLTAQGNGARGGAYDYMVGDRLFGGFALIAFPASYGSSGVMTFIVNHDGVVYSKDLGPSEVAMKIGLFDPDHTWKPEAAIDERPLRASSDSPQVR